jgi:phosphopantothenoylcysteine decarboxylase/phosphopantothenate--cysteine ligase
LSAEQKIKRTGDSLSVELVANPDIIAGVNGPFVKVGFAAETQHLREHAVAKIASKVLDFIVANDVTAPAAGFAHDTNQVTIIDRDGRAEELPVMSKYEVGHRILDRVGAILQRRG